MKDSIRQTLRDVLVFALLIAIGVVGRWAQPDWCFTPIAAVAVFAGFYFSRIGVALLVPLAVLGISDLVLPAYGSGGALYHKLVEDIFLPAFDNPILRELADSAICPVDAETIAMTTDSFVVKPRFFPGGDIGRLAVCGTINDVAMSGATPRYLTAGMIIEAGFSMSELADICRSMAEAAAEAGVLIVSGDTKVVDPGACDGIFINTSGVGVFRAGPLPDAAAVESGDKIIVSGDIANHGMAVMAARHNLGFEPPLYSDVAPLNALAAAAWNFDGGVKLMRDPTRGGIAATLNEWSALLGLPIIIEEDAVPLQPEVASACDLLGIDPFYVANEGKFLAIVAADQAQAVVSAMRAHPLGAKTAIIGEVGRAGECGAFARTCIGSRRRIGMIDGEQLPRIC